MADKEGGGKKTLSLDMQIIKPIYIFLFLPIMALAGSFFIMPVARAATPIYISQIQISGGPKQTDNDFVELFNPNSSAINLNGYRLVKRTDSATADTLIKSWDSNTNIPAHHFYLWANAKFTNISVKPDAVTTATLSANQGVALRLGSSDKGILVDSVAWGTAHNSFNNVTSISPGPGQALLREDLYSVESRFTVLGSLPRNSSQSDGTVVTKAAPIVETSPPAPTLVIVVRPSAFPKVADITAPSPSPVVLGVATAPTEAAAIPTPPLPTKSPSKFMWKSNVQYLVLVVICLVLFIVLLKKVFWLKKE